MIFIRKLPLKIVQNMKKLILGVAVAVGLISNQSASAQTFTLDKDTSKGYFFSSGYLVENKLKVNVSSSLSSSVQLDWNIASVVEPTGWSWDSFCEPSGSCWTPDADMKSGKAYMTGSLAPGSSGNFIAEFNGDGAANGTASFVTVNISYGSQSSKMVFAAYKSSTGIVTSVLKDADVNIFPNPASNYIDVIYNPAADVKTITLYNLIGKAVNVYKVTDKSSARCEFPADMPSGIYIVRIADSKGSIIATRKITHQ